MEIKAILEKPFEEKERIDFIVNNNHQLGYEIKETETELQAWGYTEEEKEEQQKQQRIKEIDFKIAELEQMVLPEIIQGNEQNVQTYKDVINSLEETKAKLVQDN